MSAPSFKCESFQWRVGSIQSHPALLSQITVAGQKLLPAAAAPDPSTTTLLWRPARDCLRLFEIVTRPQSTTTLLRGPAPSNQGDKCAIKYIETLFEILFHSY